MSEQSGQFHLFSTTRFVPYFFTQVLGAFNDNVFKNALILLITFTAASNLPLDSNIMINLAAGLFILPFFLFSATAGVLADNMDKAKLMRIIKLAEVGIMTIAAVAFYFDAYSVLFVLLFLMGTQSAFFGPVKYAVLPELLKPQELIGGNALVEMGTFIAILLGTMLGGLLVGFDAATTIVGGCVLVFAVLGYIVSRRIPSTGVAGSKENIRWAPVSQTLSIVKLAYSKRTLYLAIMAISWFWFIGASYLTQFAQYAKVQLGGNNEVVTLLLVAFSVGIAIGSLLCERLSGGKVELGIVPIGAIGMSIFGLDMYFATPDMPVTTLAGVWLFLEYASSYRVVLDLVMVGVFGGFFIVPLYAYLQQNSEEDECAQIIAANNIFNALFMVASAIFAGIFLGYFGLSISEYFFVMAIMNIVVAAYIFMLMPEFVLRFFIWVLSHTMYRVKHKGLANIPDKGAAVLVCNHVSFVDALLIAGAVRRPVRFVMERAIFESPGLGWFFKIAKTIPICPQKENPEVFNKAFDSISQALQDGDIICIFPEGKLTKDGEVNQFKRGIEQIIERDPVPVIPMALTGLWGSFFSHHGKGAFKKGSSRFWSKVQLIANPMVHAENVSAETLEDEVKKLRGDRQ